VHWKEVKGAKGYALRLTTLSDTGEEGDIAFDDPNLEPGLDYSPGPEMQVNIFRDQLNPGPGTGIVGYFWNIVAIGPEGLRGLGGENHAFAFWIWPEEPSLLEPSPDATDVGYEDTIFAFSSPYTPSGKYQVMVFAPVNWASVPVIPGNPGGITTFGPASLGISNLQPSTLYQWAVRAHSDLPWGADALYPWSELRNFWTKSKPPEPPETPTVVFEAWDGSFGVMLCFFTAVAGADHYRVEAQEIDTSDLSTPIGPTQAFDFSVPVLASYTEYVAQSLGPIPAKFFVVGLDNTQTLHAYRWRVQACNGPACSAFSDWAKWGEVFPWPF